MDRSGRRSTGCRTLIAEGLALVDKALRHRRPGPYQTQAAIGALHARAASPGETDWSGIEQLYGALERMQPSPVVTLNRAVALSKVRGAADALAMIEPLGVTLAGYFYFHGARGAFLLELGRVDEARDAWPRDRARQHASGSRPCPRPHRRADGRWARPGRPTARPPEAL